MPVVRASEGKIGPTRSESVFGLGGLGAFAGGSCGGHSRTAECKTRMSDAIALSGCQVITNW